MPLSSASKRPGLRQVSATPGAMRGRERSVLRVDGAAEWDAFVAGNEHGHHEQTSMYGAMRGAYGFESRRVVVRAGGAGAGGLGASGGDGVIVGGAQVLLQRTPLGRFGLLLRGPLAVDDEVGILRAVVAKVEAMCRARGVVVLRVDTFATQERARDVLEAAGFAGSSAWCEKRDSLVVPLVGPAEVLLAGMKRKTRYSVRSSLRAGVEVRAGDGEDLGRFYELYCQTARHQKFPVFPMSYFEYLWETLGKAGRAQHFVAEYRGQAVAAVFNTVLGERMYYTWGGIERAAWQRKLLANYPLHLAAMEWAQARGCTHYDLAGNTLFKRKFSTEMIQWPLPLRKYYGAGGELRRAVSEGVWRKQWLRQGVVRAARRLGLRRKMPY